MTDQEVLEKAIKKAIDNGWDNWGRLLGVDAKNSPNPIYQFGRKTLHFDRHPVLIYNHDFAKALWGEVKVGRTEHIPHVGTKTYYKPNTGWHYHLQRMVISDNPIHYLRDNLSE